MLPDPKGNRNMQITEETISPSMAVEMLQTNTKNRPVKQRHVDRLASDMKAGRWNYDGAPIRFAKDGTVLDGQHRLLAVIKSGKNIKFVVIRGLANDVFTTIDSGARRSTSDALFISHEKNYSVLAGALGVIVSYLKTGSLAKSVGGLGLPTTSELIDTLDTCPEIRLSANHVVANKGSAKQRSGTTALLMSPALMAGLHYLFAEKNRPLADLWVTGMASGFNPDTNPSFALLRERLLGNNMAKAKLPREYIAAICVKAWNAERGGSHVKSLRYSDEEGFPNIR